MCLRCVFSQRNGQIWIFGGWSYKYHICIFFLVGKWQPIELQSGPRNDLVLDGVGRGTSKKKAPNLGFNIAQLQRRPGLDLLKVEGLGNGKWLGFEMVKHHLGKIRCYIRLLVTSHLEPTVSGSPFNLFILHEQRWKPLMYWVVRELMSDVSAKAKMLAAKDLRKSL